MIWEEGFLITHRGTNPARTTLYHYRNTLLHLGLLQRCGKQLRANHDEPAARELLATSVPAKEDKHLSPRAQDLFASLVLKNRDCRTVFFDLFMAGTKSCYTVADLRGCGSSVDWYRPDSSPGRVVFHSKLTGQKREFVSASQKAAVLYGIRYWARDELNLIDEYSHQGDAGITMFPVSNPLAEVREAESSVMPLVHFILASRQREDWTLFSIFDLIVQCCEEGRRSIQELFCAIDWIVHHWPHHTVLVPTSRAFATMTASSQGEELALRRFYRHANGPYISHIRLHKDIKMSPIDLPPAHVQYPSETQATIQSV